MNRSFEVHKFIIVQTRITVSHKIVESKVILKCIASLPLKFEENMKLSYKLWDHLLCYVKYAVELLQIVRISLNIVVPVYGKYCMAGKVW